MKITRIIAAAVLLTSSILQAELVEHEYAQSGDWTVHYYTNASGKFVQASMIRFYDSAMLRMTIDNGNFYLDTTGDWSALGASAKEPSILVQLVPTEQAAAGGIEVEGRVINDEGDKWFRITQPLDEPSGMQDVVQNAQTLNIVFPNGKKWTFSMKGSNAAWKKVEQALEKYKK